MYASDCERVPAPAELFSLRQAKGGKSSTVFTSKKWSYQDKNMLSGKGILGS